MAINTVRAFASKTATVSSTAKSLLDLTFTQAQIDRASRAWISCITQHVHILFDGATPTSTYGLVVSQGTIFELDGNTNLQNLKMIRNGSDATVTVILGE